jgi:hypothetical protein
MSLPYALEIDPESSLQFTITRDPSADGSGGDGSSRCTMTLRHPGHTKENLAFKVRKDFFSVEYKFESVSGVLHGPL